MSEAAASTWPATACRRSRNVAAASLQAPPAITSERLARCPSRKGCGRCRRRRADPDRDPVGHQYAGDRDGLDLLGEIKLTLPELPVMMVTAYGDDERRRRAKELGVAWFFIKPVDFALLKGAASAITRCR